MSLLIVEVPLVLLLSCANCAVMGYRSVAHCALTAHESLSKWSHVCLQQPQSDVDTERGENVLPSRVECVCGKDRVINVRYKHTYREKAHRSKRYMAIVLPPKISF